MWSVRDQSIVINIQLDPEHTCLLKSLMFLGRIPNIENKTKSFRAFRTSTFEYFVPCPDKKAHRQKGSQTKGLTDKRAKNTDKRATDKKAKKAGRRAKIILIKSSIIIT